MSLYRSQITQLTTHTVCLYQSHYVCNCTAKTNFVNCYTNSFRLILLAFNYPYIATYCHIHTYHHTIQIYIHAYIHSVLGCTHVCIFCTYMLMNILYILCILVGPMTWTIWVTLVSYIQKSS